MMNRIFRITVNKWSEHNKTHRKSFKKTMISNNFCTDAKILSLPLATRWMFLGIVLECGSYNGDTIEICESQLRAIVKAPTSTIKALDQLQSFQLVTYEILALNRSEVKRREEKGRDVELLPDKGPSTSSPKKPDPCVKVLEIWNSNCGSCRKAKGLNKQRNQRSREALDKYSVEELSSFAEAIGLDEFCTGKNDRGWVADFDYFIREATLTKASEGGFGKKHRKVDVHQQIAGWFTKDNSDAF